MSVNGEPKRSADIGALTFQRLSKDCRRSEFSCGNVQIDNWLKRRAYNDHNDLLCRVVTAHFPDVVDPVGFFSMCLSIEGESNFLTYGFLKRVRFFFTDNVMLVCKLEWGAVDTKYQRQGIGTLLMGRAISDFADVVDRTGVYALVLRALNDRVQDFYADLGFEPYGDSGLRKMILPALSVMDARP